MELEFLQDWKHWVGWVLTTLLIIGVFHSLKVHGLHMPIYHAFILFGVIVIVDTVKHLTELQ